MSAVDESAERDLTFLANALEAYGTKAFGLTGSYGHRPGHYALPVPYNLEGLRRLFHEGWEPTGENEITHPAHHVHILVIWQDPEHAILTPGILRDVANNRTKEPI